MQMQEPTLMQRLINHTLTSRYGTNVYLYKTKSSRVRIPSRTVRPDREPETALASAEGASEKFGLLEKVYKKMTKIAPNSGNLLTD